jgi:purine-binding chemotaxis protein CheW
MRAVHVRVRVAGEEYALPVSGVSEIAEFEAVTPIPGAPPRVLGAINLRGQVVPVMDLAAVLGAGSDGSPRRIVIAEEGGVRAGLAVGEVLDVAEVAEPRSEADSPYLAGASPADGVMVGIVDLRAVLAPEAGG